MSNQNFDPSVARLMAEHQRQWNEHQESIAMAPTNTNTTAPAQQMNVRPVQMPTSGSTMSLPVYPSNNNNNTNQNYNHNHTGQGYAAWQHQYKQQQVNAAVSQRELYRNQMRQQFTSNGDAGMSPLTMNLMAPATHGSAMQLQQSNAPSPVQQQQPQTSNVNASAHTTQIDHAGFVPPAPQDKQEIEKYVKWRADRHHVYEQKQVHAEIERRQKKEELKLNAKYHTNVDLEKVSGFKTPLLSHADSIDYDLDIGQKPDKSGCCCVVL